MRADKFLSERFGSRSKAKEALCAGRVLLHGKPLAPDSELSSEEGLTVLEGPAFVSVGAKKLDRALNLFPVPVAGRTFAALGASTGGFTDVLLRFGASRVYAVDVGKGQLDPVIASDPRVVIMDGINARYLQPMDFPERLDGIVSDLSFISLRLVLPAVHGLLGDGASALVLFKPQFECGGKGLGKSGILPRSHHGALLADFYDFCVNLGLAPQGIVNAPLVPSKNIEYVVWLKKGTSALAKSRFLASAGKFFEEI